MLYEVITGRPARRGLGSRACAVGTAFRRGVNRDNDESRINAHEHELLWHEDSVTNGHSHVHGLVFRGDFTQVKRGVLCMQNGISLLFVADEDRFRFIRITSYNVCYTKLLRRTV